MTSTMPTVRLSQPSQPPYAQVYEGTQHFGDYDQGVEIGRGLRRMDPQLTTQHLQHAQQMQQQPRQGAPQHQQQQMQQQQQPQFARPASTVNGGPPPPSAQVQHHPQHLQHPQQAHPHAQQQQQQGYPVGIPHLTHQQANQQQQQQQVQSSPHLVPQGHPSHYQVSLSGSQTQQQPPRPRNPPVLQVQTALGASGVPIAPPFLSPAPGQLAPAQQHDQQQLRQNQQHQQQTLQMQHQQQFQQQPTASTSFLPAGSGTQGSQGPSSAPMMSRDLQTRTSSQGSTGSQAGSLKGRGEKEEEEQYFVELIYEFLFKSGLYATARALLAETSNSALSPSGRAPSLTASPSSLAEGSPLPSNSTINTKTHSRNNLTASTSSKTDPLSGNLDHVLRGSPPADEVMKSPSSRKTGAGDEGEGMGAVGTLPSPESGTGGSIGGVKDEGGSENAMPSSANTAVSESGTSRRKDVGELSKLREPVVEGGSGPKGQLIEWWSIFQDISKAQPAVGKSSSDSELYVASVASGQTLPSSTTSLVGPSAVNGQAPPHSAAFVGGPQQGQRVVVGQQQMQPGQKRVVMAGAHGVPVSHQWQVSRDGPEGHPAPISLQQQQQAAMKNQMQGQRVQPGQGPNVQLQQQRVQQQPMSQFAGNPPMDLHQQVHYAQQQGQAQHQQQLQDQRYRSEQMQQYRALVERVRELGHLLGISPETVHTYCNLPVGELHSIYSQLSASFQQRGGQAPNGLGRRPLADGDEPSPKRTRVEGPPKVSMEQQQQQAMRLVSGGQQQQGRAVSGQMHPNGQQQHLMQQQGQYNPEFNPQATGRPNPAQMKAESQHQYAQEMHRRASQQTDEARAAQAAGSPYANGSMMPPPATPAFAGSPPASQQYDQRGPRPASQASHHGGSSYPGSGQMSRSNSQSDVYGNGNVPTPGPESTPRTAQGVLPAGGEPQGNAAPAVSAGGKGKAKAPAKKSKAKKPGKAAAPTLEPLSPVPALESQPSPYPQAPQSAPPPDASPYPPQQPLPLPPSPSSAQQQQQDPNQHQHHHQHSATSGFDLNSLGDANAFDASQFNLNLGDLDLDPAMLFHGDGAGNGEDFDFSSWMVDETQ